MEVESGDKTKLPGSHFPYFPLNQEYDSERVTASWLENFQVMVIHV